MKAQYQKYLDTLKGKDFSTPVGKYTNALSTSTTKLSTAESIINSSTWIEKGLDIVKGSVIPSLKSQTKQLETGISALTQVSGKVNELVGQVETLKKLEESLNNLGSKWTYKEDGKKTQSEVNNHNKLIDDTKEQIQNQEEAIDSTVASINGISFSFISTKSTFSITMTNLKNVVELEKGKEKEATTAPPEETKEKDKNKNDDLNVDKKDVYSTNSNFESGVLSYEVGDISAPGREAKVLGKRATLLDVVCDGHSLGQDGSITIKKGETVHLKVKIPDEIDNVQTIIRNNYGGNGWSRWVSQTNYPQVKQNNKSTFLNQREYDWYITGDKLTNGVTISQTALFKIPGAKLNSYKGMVRVKVKVVE